jgi:hypothetical protein
MRFPLALAPLAASLLLGACDSTEKEWMKIGQRYTTEEFRRDHAACSKGSRLDEACMRGRGWVDVNAGKSDRVQSDPEYKRPFGTPADAYRPTPK